jgi:hypothetical protein
MVNNLSDCQFTYNDYIKRNQQFFEKSFIKGKVLKDIIYKPIQKMFLRFGASMFLGIFIGDILLFVKENYVITKVDKAKLEKVCRIMKNIEELNLKIANELYALTKNF